MKWFKHLSGSLNNSDIFEAIERFGSDGYLVFFGTLELMADEFDPNHPGIYRISTKKLTKNLQLSRQKTIKILKYFHEKERIFVEEQGDFLLLNCPKLADLSDEYTDRQLKKMSGQSPDKCRDKLPPTEAEVEAEVEADKDSKDLKRSSSESGKNDSDGNGKIPPCPQQEIVALYHEKLPSLPRVKAWAEHLQAILRTRWKEDPQRQELKWWALFFEYISKSEFLMGRTESPFTADLEWLIRPKNFTKIANGRYHSVQGAQHRAQPGIEAWLKKKEAENAAQGSV